MERAPAVQFLGFLDMCTEAWRQRVRSVTLISPSYSMKGCEDNPLLMLDLHVVMHTCERYPSMTVRWHLELLPDACSRSSLTSFLHNALILVQALRRDFASNSTLEGLAKELRLWPFGSVVGLYHKFWCKQGDGRRLAWNHHPECDSMIKAHNFRIVPFKERFTESAFKKMFIFDIGGAQDGPKEKTVDEKHLVVAKDWWTNGL
jgi:hypothetical protein